MILSRENDLMLLHMTKEYQVNKYMLEAFKNLLDQNKFQFPEDAFGKEENDECWDDPAEEDDVKQD